MNKQAQAFLALYKKATFLFPALGIVIGICYFLAMRTDFEANIGHFARGSGFAGTAAGLCILSILLAASLAFLSRKKITPDRVPERDPLLLIAAILGTVGAAGTLLLLLLSILEPSVGASDAHGRLTVFADLAASLVIPALILTLLPDFAASDARAFFWIGSAAAVILSLFACYFNFDVPLNSPVRNFTAVMQSSLLLLCLAESRLALDPKAARFYVTAPFHIFACGTASSVALGLSLGGLLNALLNSGASGDFADPNLPAFRLLLYFALALFGLSRLLALPKIAGPYRAPTAETSKPQEPKQPNPSV